MSLPLRLEVGQTVRLPQAAKISPWNAAIDVTDLISNAQGDYVLPGFDHDLPKTMMHSPPSDGIGTQSAAQRAAIQTEGIPWSGPVVEVDEG
jgi:hypothetical protein